MFFKDHVLLMLLIIAVVITGLITTIQEVSEKWKFETNETDPEKIVIPEGKQYIVLHKIKTLNGIKLPESARQLIAPNLKKITGSEASNWKKMITYLKARNLEWNNFSCWPARNNFSFWLKDRHQARITWQS